MIQNVTARIALDAMGGDRAPEATVLGALEAVRQDPHLEVVLAGQQKLLEDELGALDLGEERERIRIQPASQVVHAGDPASTAVRRKDNSIRRCAELLAEKEVDGMVAAGNTGGTVAAALVVVGLLPGVKRPGIAVPLPTAEGGVAILCDAGANIHPKPLHLFQYGVMASEFARLVLDREHPSVGLLNVGSEEGKGTDLEKETASLFNSDASLNFIGNVEGNDIFSGRIDVIVCDGFVGNVVLKTAEGLYEVMSGRLKAALPAVASISDDPRFGKAIQEFRRGMDYADHGGAPLLGVDGVVMISHGRSDARAVRNAIAKAAGVHRLGVISAMITHLKSDANRSSS